LRCEIVLGAFQAAGCLKAPVVQKLPGACEDYVADETVA
jgi:hypothetical protein